MHGGVSVSLISLARLLATAGHVWSVCGVTGPLAGLVLADLPCQVQRQLQPLLLPHSFYLDNLN